MQCWGNGSGSISNNFFYGTVSGKNNVGAIVGYLKSFDKFQGFQTTIIWILVVLHRESVKWKTS